MNSSDQDKQEQRTNSTMEDSTTMTIEFLRARLLSERSVSKSARQRAEELEKRVMELEDQLKIISIQRKRAEKATADVLAILENNGISDLSEEYDSNSDHENSHESQIGDGSAKEERSFVNSKLRKNESEELSGSDHDFLSAPGRSLSWKGCRSTSNSPEKYKGSLTRRGNSFGSVGFPQLKHIRGKSCRQIKRRELRVAEELKTDNGKVNSQVREVVTCVEINTSHSEDGPNILRVCPEIGEDKGSIDRLHVNTLKDGKNETRCDLDLNGSEGERNMEKALEHQAQLIGRYEAMERAQREWEQKFRENNVTLDSCDPGNHSDVTEERDEIRTNAQTVAVTTALSYQDSEAEICQKFSKTQSICSTLQSDVDISHIQDHRCGSPATESFGSKSQNQVATFPMIKQCFGMENLQINHFQPAFHPHPRAYQKSHCFLRTSGTHRDREETSGSQKELYALVPQETSSEFAGVLDALKQAKQSLQKKVNKFPVVEKGAFRESIGCSIPVTEITKRLAIPVGCAALFRVPADFSAETSKPSFLGSGSQLNLARYYPDTVPALTGSDQLVTSSANSQVAASLYRDSNSRSSTALTSSSYVNSDGLVNGRYPETMPNTSTDNPNFNPFMNRGLPATGLHNPLAFSSYPNPSPPSRTRDGHPTFMTSMTEASPDGFSFYDNHFKPNLFR